MRKPPFISIVTITRNDRAGLAYTVNTVANQTYPNYEHLVIDGMSSDGTAEYCAATKKRLANFSYVSEKDNGIYDAMNKGAGMARGDLLVFVNSSDGLTDSAVLEFVAERWQESDWQWGYGAMRFTAPTTRIPVAGTVKAPFNRRKFEFGRMYIPHPASYVRRQLFLDAGGFDESFGTAADQEFWIRIGRTQTPEVWIRFLADLMEGGVSNQQTIWHIEKLWHLMRVKNGAAIANSRHVDRAASIGVASAIQLGVNTRKILRRI